MSNLNRLKCRVIAVNRCNEEAMKLYDKLVEIFKPLVGQKILKTDGTYLEKIKKLVGELNNDSTRHLWIVKNGSDQHSLSYNVRYSEWDGGNNQSHQISIRIGGLIECQILRSINEKPILRTNYTVEEIELKRQIFQRKEEEYRAARADLDPFGEYDS